MPATAHTACAWSSAMPPCLLRSRYAAQGRGPPLPGGSLALTVEAGLGQRRLPASHSVAGRVRGNARWGFVMCGVEWQAGRSARRSYLVVLSGAEARGCRFGRVLAGRWAGSQVGGGLTVPCSAGLVPRRPFAGQPCSAGLVPRRPFAGQLSVSAGRAPGGGVPGCAGPPVALSGGDAWLRWVRELASYSAEWWLIVKDGDQRVRGQEAGWLGQIWRAGSS
jgi:hypothetical protein